MKYHFNLPGVTQSAWLHPRLRFFIGRENKLPVGQNLFMALTGCTASLHVINPAGYPEKNSDDLLADDKGNIISEDGIGKTKRLK